MASYSDQCEYRAQKTQNRCNNDVIPGLRYCFKHRGFDESSAQNLNKERHLLVTLRDKVEKECIRLDTIIREAQLELEPLVRDREDLLQAIAQVEARLHNSRDQAVQHRMYVGNQRGRIGQPPIAPSRTPKSSTLNYNDNRSICYHEDDDDTPDAIGLPPASIVSVSPPSRVAPSSSSGSYGMPASSSTSRDRLLIEAVPYEAVPICEQLAAIDLTSDAGATSDETFDLILSSAPPSPPSSPALLDATHPDIQLLIDIANGEWQELITLYQSNMWSVTPSAHTPARWQFVSSAQEQLTQLLDSRVTGLIYQDSPLPYAGMKGRLVGDPRVATSIINWLQEYIIHPSSLVSEYHSGDLELRCSIQRKLIRLIENTLSVYIGTLRSKYQ